MSTGHLIHRKNVRGALKRLDPKRLRELGEEPLAELGAAEARRQAAGYPATVEGRGRALRDLLTDALDALKPEGAAEIDFPDPAWRLYLILTEQYVKGGDPWRLAEGMYIGRDTFNHSQADALDAIVRWLQGANEAVEAEAPRPPVYNAPSPQGVKLIGRDGVMRELRSRLTAGGAVAVHGLAGAGKSTLAAAVANDAELLAHFADGVLWAALGQGGDALAWLGEWAVLLSVPRSELAHMLTLEARSGAVHGAIGTRRMLLVIDDAWSSEAALALRVGGPNCAHLLTARAASVALDFAGPNAIALHELDDASGLALLAHHAPDAVAYEPEAAQALAHAVGGLPLALMLMGRHLHKAGRGGQRRRLRDALEDLQQAEARLALTHRDAPHERKRELPPEASLSAVIGLSEAMLDESARRAWHALSVFPPKPNTFSEEAALAVAAEPPETLDALVDAGVLEVKNGRYGMHTILVDFGRVVRDDTALRDRYVSFFFGLVDRDDYPLVGVADDVANILRALELARRSSQFAALIRVSNGLFSLLESQGKYVDAENHLLDALHAAESVSDQSAQAYAWMNLGRLALRCANYALAKARLETCIRITQMVGDPRLAAASLCNMGNLQVDLGDYATADADFAQSLEIVRNLHDTSATSHVLLHISSFLDIRGRYAESLASSVEGLDLARKVQRSDLVAMHLAQLGAVKSKCGELETGLTCLQDALGLARKIRHLELISTVLLMLGLGSVQFGEFDLARSVLDEGEAIAQRIRLRRLMTLFTSAQARLAAESQDFAKARILLSTSLEEARLNENVWDLCCVLNSSGRILQLLDDHAGAVQYLRESMIQAQLRDFPEMRGYAAFMIAQIMRQQGNASEAMSHAVIALEDYTKIGYWQKSEVMAWLDCEIS